MSWKSWLRSIATHIVVGVVMFLVGRLTTPAPETATINLAESEKQLITQEARIGYISLDSAKALVVSESRVEWIVNYKDSIVIKDSLNIRDSVIYIPVYTAADTIIHFNDTTETATVSLAVKLKQRFFPLQERFASELKLMNLKVELPEEPEISGWFKNFFLHRFIVYIGFGINYFAKEIVPGLQAGVGVRVW